MTRRIVFILTALVGLAGAALVLASPASAQIDFFIDFEEFFVNLFNSFPSFLQGILGPIFGAILSLFTGNCAPFCSS